MSERTSEKKRSQGSHCEQDTLSPFRSLTLCCCSVLSPPSSCCRSVLSPPPLGSSFSSYARTRRWHQGMQRPDGTSADYDAQAASKSRQGLVCVVVRPYEVPVSVANARRACRSKSAEKLAHFCCYIADSLEKTRDSLVFYRASSYLIFIWFPLDSPPSGLILSVQGRRLRYLALTLAPIPIRRHTAMMRRGPC